MRAKEAKALADIAGSVSGKEIVERDIMDRIEKRARDGKYTAQILYDEGDEIYSNNQRINEYLTNLGFSVVSAYTDEYRCFAIKIRWL